ncbi:MAG: bifunctional enoyl-CoA hydratase/phosphate acetyltransferase [Gammaproteobacteria bacterium]|nr:bifunctional enoyl-CoA hydratase/phosphate acetyltransferase [Gammaproteobacteria bacterium]
MEYLENRTFDEIQVGDTASLTRTLTENDIQVFAIMSGDINPAHVDAEYAKSEMFHQIIGHGMWAGALISTVLGTQLPGPGTIYISQTIRFKKPVLIGDTITVEVIITEKIPEKKRVILACTCRNQNDQNVVEGQAEVIAPTKKIRRPKALLPHLTLRRPYSLFEPFLDRAKAIGPLRAGVVYPVHPKIIAAVSDAKERGLIEPVLIGPRDRIYAAAKEAKINIGGFALIETEHCHAAIVRGVQLARDGDIGLLIRGGATREEFIRLLQKPEKGLTFDTVLSNATVLDVPTYPKALILTDTLINIDPSLDVKRSITQNAIDFARALEITEPKVAILAGVDAVNYHMRSTVDAAALCKMAERGQIHGGILDGPLTFDNVISIEVAREKGIESPVVGNADIIIVPNVETGNILVKQLEYLAESKNAGIVLGGRVPVLMSHISNIYLSSVSCALAILNTDYQRRRYHLDKESL